jgi:hypothetical protein
VGGPWADLELCFASVVDADRARFLPVGQRHQEIGELRAAVLGNEPFDVVPPAPPARIAHNSERRLANVGQDQRAVAGHGLFSVRPVVRSASLTITSL